VYSYNLPAHNLAAADCRPGSLVSEVFIVTPVRTGQRREGSSPL